MTLPLWCLLVATFLPYVFAGTGTYFKARQFGAVDNHNPRDQSARLTGIGARANAAQQNAWEALPVFGFAVLVAHVASADPGSSATAATVWVAARIAHGVCYLADLAALRSLAFMVGTFAAIALYVLAAQAA